MSSMNPPWEAGWPGRAGRPHRRPRHPGPGFGAGFTAARFARFAGVRVRRAGFGFAVFTGARFVTARFAGLRLLTGERPSRRRTPGMGQSRGW